MHSNCFTVEPPLTETSERRDTFEVVGGRRRRNATGSSRRQQTMAGERLRRRETGSVEDDRL